MLLDRETTNFTYDIANRDEMAAVLGQALIAAPEVIAGFAEELAADQELRREIEAALVGRRDRNRRMPFGRRLGWYAIVRLRKPRLVVETGVHDGLGSTAILQALDRNAADGAEGTLLSIDVAAGAGWLIPARLRSRHRLLTGRSIELIAGSVTAPVDVFVHDSDHRYAYELAELEAIRPKAGPEIVYLSDNAHATTALRDFAAGQGLAFAFWREQPVAHFYPGAGIGIALRRG